MFILQKDIVVRVSKEIGCLPAEQSQSAHGRDKVVRSPVLVDLERVDEEEDQGHEPAKEATAVNTKARRSREQSPLDKGRGEHPRHPEPKQQTEPGTSRDIPVIEILSSSPEESEEAQPLSEGVEDETNTNSDQTHRSNGEAQSGSKRVDDFAQELPGQQKRQRAEPRVLFSCKTVMDVIRSRCPPPSTSTVDEDEEFLLSLIKKAGVRWPPIIRD